jgi:hypothetical protein
MGLVIITYHIVENYFSIYLKKEKTGLNAPFFVCGAQVLFTA